MLSTNLFLLTLLLTSYLALESYSVSASFLKSWLAWESPGGLVRTQSLGPTLRASNAVGCWCFQTSDHTWNSLFQAQFFFFCKEVLFKPIMGVSIKKIYVNPTASGLIGTQQKGSLVSIMILFFYLLYFSAIRRTPPRNLGGKWGCIL